MAAQPTVGGTLWGAEQNAFTGTSIDPATGKIKNEALQVADTAPIADAALANKKYVDDSIGFLSFGESSVKTISSGAITATQTFTGLDTEGGASTDDLDTINGGETGSVVILKTSSSSRNVVLRNGTGNLDLAGNFTLENVVDTIMLINGGTSWREISRSTNGV